MCSYQEAYSSLGALPGTFIRNLPETGTGNEDWTLMPGTQQSDRKGLKSTNSFCFCWVVCSREVRAGEAFCGNFCVSCLYIQIKNCTKLSKAGEINSLQDDRGNVTEPHTLTLTSTYIVTPAGYALCISSGLAGMGRQ